MSNSKDRRVPTIKYNVHTKYNWRFWYSEQQPLPENPIKIRKHSICTTCMDRTHYLEQTFIKNIEDNKEYPDKEFVLLNYNSHDNLDDWVKQNLMTYIESGVVNYYKTTEPQYYEMGHSRNLAFRLAQGETVHSVDADNFIGPNFFSTINKMCEIYSKKVLFSKARRQRYLGRLGFYKEDFVQLRGYDEDFEGYGYDDEWLVWRVMAAGFVNMSYNELCPAQRIKNSKEEHSKNLKNPIQEDKQRNLQLLLDKLNKEEFFNVNKNRHWGKGTVIKNFKEEISI